MKLSLFKSFTKNHFTSFIFICALSMLSACGGGEVDTPDDTNIEPTVSAGNDQSVDAQSQVQLVATAVDIDGSIASYLWEQLSGSSVELQSATSANASFTAPSSSEDEVLRFRVTVTDNQGATASDQVDILVMAEAPTNNPPTVNAGSDQTVESESTVQLSASASDSDGSIVSYAWTQTGGTSVAINQADSANASFSAPALNEAETLSFSVTVTDNLGATASDAMTVQVNPQAPANIPPTLNAGSDQTVDASTSVQLSAVASDSDGEIVSYLWTQTSGTSVEINNADSANAGFIAPQLDEAQALSFSATVTDNSGASVSDTVVVQVNAVIPANTPPSVDTGEDQVVESEATVQLVAFAEDSDGEIVSYLWTQTAGTSVVLNNADAANANFVAPLLDEPETLSFLVTVTDDQGATATDSINIQVNAGNRAPNITGSFPAQVTVGNSYDYTPSATDEDGDNLTFSIENKPDWASFETATGRLWGTPGEESIGIFANIQINVSDGTATDALPEFSIEVVAASDDDEDCADIKVHCVAQSAGQNQEFDNIQDALLEAMPGHTVKVFSGTYNGFVIERSGTAAEPITIKASGTVNLEGSASNYNNMIRFQRVSYVSVDGFTIRCDGSANPYNYDYAGIAARGANASSPMVGLQIKNTEVTGCSPAGIYLSQVRGLVFENNYIHDNILDQQGGRGMGVYLANASTDNVIVRNNTLADNANAGMHLNGDSSVGGDGVQTGHLFENNIVVGNGQNGINMDGIQSSSFINNVFANNSKHGIRNFQIDAADGPKDLVLVNNTFYSNGDNAAKFSSDSGGHVLFNNLLIDNGANSFNLNESSASLASNLYSSDETIFIDAAQRDFRIKQGSEPVDAGTSSFEGVNAPTLDLNGFERVSVPDIGAYELDSEPQP